MTALVFCWYWSYCVTQIPSLHLRFRKYQIAYNNIEEVHQAIQDFEIQIQKFSVYSTQGIFCKLRLLIVCYSTLIAFNYALSNALVTAEREKLLHYIQTFVLHYFI